MSEHDELAALIWGVEAEEVGTFKTGVTSKAADDIADAILAAGWRPPTPAAHVVKSEDVGKAMSVQIPAEAVEAACEQLPYQSADEVRAALEAAAPHMLAEAFEEAADEFHARLPDGTGNGRAYNSHQVARILRDRAARIGPAK